MSQDEVVGQPQALVAIRGHSKDKFFHMVQRLKQKAKRPDCVVLRCVLSESHMCFVCGEYIWYVVQRLKQKANRPDCVVLRLVWSVFCECLLCDLSASVSSPHRVPNS